MFASPIPNDQRAPDRFLALRGRVRGKVYGRPVKSLSPRRRGTNAAKTSVWDATYTPWGATLAFLPDPRSGTRVYQFSDCDALRKISSSRRRLPSETPFGKAPISKKFCSAISLLGSGTASRCQRAMKNKMM